MPPRGRGGPRGASPRGGPSRGGRGASPQIGLPKPGDHITTVGVKRPDFGIVGREVPIFVNSFVTTIPENIIHHYDVISPSEKTLPARVNLDLITQLQTVVAPGIFTPRAVYDGRKNLFAIRELPFGESGSQEFEVSMSRGRPDIAGRGPKTCKIVLSKVAEINPEVLKRFVAGEQSHDNNVLTVINALNVVIRMEPTMKYPFNLRSFFTNQETKDIGEGLQLWRGYFQSVRPAIGRLLINVDISTVTMYKEGTLIQLCLDFLKKQDVSALAPRRGLPDRERLRLQRFISGVRVLTTQTGEDGTRFKIPRVVKKVSAAGASGLTFTMREGGSMNVAEYFRRVQARPLQYPDLICVEVGSGALIPIELCEVPPGQIMRKQVPAEKIREVIEFATKSPKERLESIKNGLAVLAYGQSEYVRQFGMHVNTSGPLKIQARVLKPPTLKYGVGSRQVNVVPNNGSWNMVDKRFFKPMEIPRWVVVIYETLRRFPEAAARDMISGLVDGCREVGMGIQPTDIIRYENGQGRISEGLLAAGQICVDRTGFRPTLIIVVLPENGNDIYTAVKHFGDITHGVATQCLKSTKCFKARPQYFANVSLKINVKLGGINMIPDPDSVAVLSDPRNPTIVMGADVIHPAPGSEGRPSFTALVANVDAGSAKYIADSRVQTSRQEMIDDLQAMCKHVLEMYMVYRDKVEKRPSALLAPARIIFYRDGVSEGQFEQVLKLELPLIKNACRELGINPKITIIIVGKRHHVRFFPQNDRDADRSGNCQAGTVVDREVAHPTEFDFYLQSHGGLLGTSRPAHYSVLYDENGFKADTLQSLSFALCHVYARSTRSVSIPAPVYYADIVCSRAKNHYDPQGLLNFSDSATHVDSEGGTTLDAFRRNFKKLHQTQSRLMYFS